MTRVSTRLVMILLLAALVAPTPISAQATNCSGYDSQIWAQSVFETSTTRYAALDPDGNGLACEDLPTGAAPAGWTTGVPAGAKPAQLESVTDGDTIRVNLGGQVESVGLILIDSPETSDSNAPLECYGAEATSFLTWLFSLGDSLYLESDVSDQDRFGQLPRYAWLDLGEGEVYLVNEVMARSGYAAQSSFPPDVKYEEEILEATRFAREHEYGLWSECVTNDDGDTNELSVSETVTPNPETARVAEESGQPEPAPQQVIISDPPEAFGCDTTSPDTCIPAVTPAPDGESVSEESEESEESLEESVIEAPGQTERPPERVIISDPAEAFGCDPSYPDICIPPGVADLECVHIYDQGLSHITVYPPDPHGFDENFDGVGCESPP